MPRLGFTDHAVDLDLLAKLANGVGGARTGALKAAGLIDWTVTPAGLALLEQCTQCLRWFPLDWHGDLVICAACVPKPGGGT